MPQKYLTSGLFVDTWRPEIPSCCIRCPMNPLFINFTPSPHTHFFFYLPLQTTFNLLSFKLLNAWQRGRNSRELQWHFLFYQKNGNYQSKALSWGDLSKASTLFAANFPKYGSLFNRCCYEWFSIFSKLFCGVVYLLIRKLINVLSRSVAGNYAIIIRSVKF